VKSTQTGRAAVEKTRLERRGLEYLLSAERRRKEKGQFYKETVN